MTLKGHNALCNVNRV